MGPEGFTPAILVFGAHPRLPNGNHTQFPPTVAQRMEIAPIARREYDNIVAKLLIQNAQSTPTTSEIFLAVNPGEKIFAYREKKGCDGPYTFLSNIGKLALVRDTNGKDHTFHVTMLKPYVPLPPFREIDPQASVYISHIVKTKNPPEFADIQQKEYDGIVRKGGVRPVLLSNLPPNSNFIENRFVKVIKDYGSPFERKKSRWILQGHTDREKDSIVNETPVLMRYSVRIILFCTISIVHNRSCTRDAEQAFFFKLDLSHAMFTPYLQKSLVWILLYGPCK